MFAASVGFAVSSKMLQGNGLRIHIYCIFGDGCYQEGISQEAFSLCSKLRLGNITFIYDFNKITIDGSTELSMNESVEERFSSLDFDVLSADGNDPSSIRTALDLISKKAESNYFTHEHLERILK